jgi:hypothetical protein
MTGLRSGSYLALSSVALSAALLGAAPSRADEPPDVLPLSPASTSTAPTWTEEGAEAWAADADARVVGAITAGVVAGGTTALGGGAALAILTVGVLRSSVFMGDDSASELMIAGAGLGCLSLVLPPLFGGVIANFVAELSAPWWVPFLVGAAAAVGTPFAVCMPSLIMLALVPLATPEILQMAFLVSAATAVAATPLASGLGAAFAWAVEAEAPALVRRARREAQQQPSPMAY